MASQPDEEVADLLRAAETQFTDGRFDEAAETLARASALAPNNAAIHVSRGFALAQAGHRGKAVGMYRQAIRLERNYAPPYFQWGLILAQQGKSEKAIEKYER